MDNPRPARARTARRFSLARALASMRLGVVLLALIAAASTVGVILPQPESFNFPDYVQERIQPGAARAFRQDEFLKLADAAGAFRPSGSLAEFHKRLLANEGAHSHFYHQLLEEAKSRGLPDERLAPLLYEAMLARGQRAELTEAEWQAVLGETLKRLRQGHQLRPAAWSAFLTTLARRVQADQLAGACLRLAYVDSYGPLLGRLMLAARLHVVFRSWWFRGLCLFLVVNMVACSLRRLPAQWRAAFGLRPSKDPRWYAKRSIAAELAVRPPSDSDGGLGARLREQGFEAQPSAVDRAAAAVHHALRQAGFRVRRRRGTGVATLEAHRGWLGGAARLWAPLGRLSGLGRLGSQIVHLGVLVIVIGGFAAGQLSFRHAQLLGAGDVVVVPDLSYRLSPRWQWRRLRTAARRLVGAEPAPQPTPEEKVASARDWREGIRPPGGKTAFTMRLERFEVRFDDRGKPEYYGSHATLLDTEPPTPVTIEVNRPLIYRGFHVYQTSYQADYRNITSVTFLVARVRRHGERGALAHAEQTRVEKLAEASVVARPGEPIKVPGGDLVLTVEDYFPHWQMPFERGPDGRPVPGKPRNVSNEPHNPAIRLRLEERGSAPLVRWVMLPLRPGEPRQGGVVDYADYRVAPVNFSPAYATWLTFKTHPVMGPVWTGCAAMMLGIFLCFYANHERVWVLVRRERGGGCTVHLAGNCFKWRERFRQRFASVVRSIEQEVAAER